jgi:hypothetical protein
MLLASIDEMAYSNFMASPGKSQSLCAFLKVSITVPFRAEELLRIFRWIKRACKSRYSELCNDFFPRERVMLHLPRIWKKKIVTLRHGRMKCGVKTNNWRSCNISALPCLDVSEHSHISRQSHVFRCIYIFHRSFIHALFNEFSRNTNYTGQQNLTFFLAHELQ